MCYTTGLTKAQITELCAKIEAHDLKPGMRKWPPILGLRNALTVRLAYLRRNRVQAEIAETCSVSQPTPHQPRYIGHYPAAGASAS